MLEEDQDLGMRRNLCRMAVKCRLGRVKRNPASLLEIFDFVGFRSAQPNLPGWRFSSARFYLSGQSFGVKIHPPK